MRIELDDADAQLLRQILERHLGELRMEISNTESHDWRERLHADEERIKSLLQRLPA